MRNLTEKKTPNNQQNISPTSKRINCQISQPLLIKCQNFITSQHLAHDYTYSSLSDLIRKSLIAYQQKQLNLTIPRPQGQPKKSVALVFPPEL